jgi:hypothetical protein
MNISSCELIDSKIAFYLWDMKIKECHNLIRKNIYVDDRVILNRILEYETMVNKWRTSIFVESWRTEHLEENIQCRVWGQNNVETTRTAKWTVTSLQKIGDGEYLSLPLNYREDPKSARNYLSELFVNGITNDL